MAAATLYLTTGLIDEAGINNGVGSARPFSYAGMRGLDGTALAHRLQTRALPGVRFTPTAWVPRSGFWAGKTLSGVAIDVTDPHVYESVRTAVEILCATRAIAPRLMKLHDARIMDRDWGTANVREGVFGDLDPDAIIAAWQPQLRSFDTLRRAAFLYT